MTSFRLPLLALLAMHLAFGQSDRGLLVMSIDGLNPNYVLQADKYGLKIPNLRRMVREGAHATGVRGVLPTVTYPTHTTMMTGVPPSEHGISQNVTFDPERTNQAGWYWYAEDIRRPTLWQMADKAGYKVGSVSWPVTVSAPGIHHNIPEYWRSMTGADDLRLLKAISTPGLLNEFEPALGKYIVDLDIAVPGDWQRVRYAELIIKTKKTRFFTIHIASLDHIEHETGPGSKKGFEALEAIDEMVGVLEKAMLSIAPKASICVLSDHGMSPVEHELHVNVALVKAGLLKFGPDRGAGKGPGVLSWKAQAWSAGGSAAIIVKDPADEGQVKALLDSLAADPANGIEAVLTREGIAKLGGAPQASFWIDMKPGFVIGAAAEGPLVRTVARKGTHGYSPVHPIMQASFFMKGPGIQKDSDLGKIDVRTIAGRLAAALGVQSPNQRQ